MATARATCRSVRARHALRSGRGCRSPVSWPGSGCSTWAEPWTGRRPDCVAVLERWEETLPVPARPGGRRHARLAAAGRPARARPAGAPPDLPVRRQLPPARDRPRGRPPLGRRPAHRRGSPGGDRRDHGPPGRRGPAVRVHRPAQHRSPVRTTTSYSPPGPKKPDWELELAAVIARPAYRVSVEEALEYVAGYTIANDLTDRATVFRRDMPAIGTDWLRCKNAPGFTPLGPVDRPRRVDRRPR